MLAVEALEILSRKLGVAIGAMGLHAGEFGKPELVEKPVREAERIFQGYSKATPSKEDAYDAARAFLRGRELDPWQREFVASALAVPIREQNGGMVLGAKRFPALLAEYEKEAQRGDLWRLTWYGLLCSYFHFDPVITKDEVTHNGWEALRSFLVQTWPLIDRQAGQTLVPDWVHVLRKESAVLTRMPVEKYTAAYLSGETAAAAQLSADLGIPSSSWFWHALVLGTVKRATDIEDDGKFRRHIPLLLRLLDSKPAFRDEALEAILIRYEASKDAPQDEHLRDYVCQPSVWKNPKLRAAGLATAWNRVPDAVWQMVLNWVNEQNLKDFFDILAARNNADEGRLAFWSRYLKQITWTRLIFGAETMALKHRNPEIRALIAREEGAYAQLTAKREVDAFMMQIGSYVIIEFSKKPNACYVYSAGTLPFERYAKYYHGGTSDLSTGFHQSCPARIVHTPGWEKRAKSDLEELGIRPDYPGAQRGAADPMPASRHWSGATANHRDGVQQGLDMGALRVLLERYDGASIDDRRKSVSGGGRLWVEDPMQRTSLGAKLKDMGFRWANSRQAWYFPES
ncbi:EH signature domain-containing protein [Paraburkholderia guartelaensis]|uniref:EH signature domain-containing protein n=1 Tax=Paraburkholderia guartelaensis TaxID=2546446 RepID=UPI002AB6CE30|nr:EH signature domain-containing protein [Paraburkholderia guartelaensis]